MMILKMRLLPIINNLVSVGSPLTCLTKHPINIISHLCLSRYSSSLTSLSDKPDEPSGTQPEISDAFKVQRLKSINRSMQLYLEKARANDEFMAKEIREFETGKRHLANMMSLDPDEMTQGDIDEAIKYLFPSGLFDKRARPTMRHPDLIYQKRKEAQFDIEGRPYHYLFYTKKPIYYETLHNLSSHVETCNKHEDEQLAQGIINPLSSEQYAFAGRQWLSRKEFIELLLEDIDDADYNYIIRNLDFLQSHPYSNLARSFLDRYSKPMAGQSVSLELPELQKNEDGKTFVTFTSQMREIVMEVTTIFDGTGIIDIMGHDILYFEDITYREAILFPLQMSGMLDKVDIHAKIVRSPQHVGDAQIAVAIRQAVALSIASYIDDETREKMRLCGLLTIDIRKRERKKFGQEGARRKYTWKKR